MDNKILNSNPIDPIDLTEVLKGISDKWIILSDDYKKVIKQSDTIDELKAYFNQGILMFVSNPNYGFIS
ncbi:MAG TPA: hypothetical protein VIK14_06590 [Ignavibacteria bacterium]